MDYKEIKQMLKQNEDIFQIYCQSLNEPRIDAKALKFYAKQLLILKPLDRQKCSELFDEHPNLRQWLHLSNISESSLNKIISQKFKFVDLYSAAKVVSDLRDCLERRSVRLDDKELNLIFTNLNNLRRYCKKDQRQGPKPTGGNVNQAENNSQANNSKASALLTSSVSTQSKLQDFIDKQQTKRASPYPEHPTSRSSSPANGDDFINAQRHRSEEPGGGSKSSLTVNDQSNGSYHTSPSKSMPKVNSFDDRHNLIMKITNEQNQETTVTNGSSGDGRATVVGSTSTTESVTSASSPSNPIKDTPNFNISYEEITERSEIGKGRFGTVYKAYWHGEIAIKEIELASDGGAPEALKAFTEEVNNLRKTRHTNLMLIYGACINATKCAIVMPFCRGSISLFKSIHVESYTAMNFDWILNVATQIAQGMAYLHNKQIVHTDLRSKNVFIDGHKAVISDFGLYSLNTLSKTHNRKFLLPFTKECLYYMAPEVVKALGTRQLDESFSKLSDVYAFGTICYEMFCHDFPFAFYGADTILYLVGHSMKCLPPMSRISKEFKDILLQCWSRDAQTRPSFAQLLETFRSVPKKSKVSRSPSHPALSMGRSV